MTAPYALAVDVGGSHIAVAIVSDQGILRKRSLDVRPSEGLQGYLEPISQLADQLFAEIPAAVDHCTGVGMAVPMLVDSRAGRVISTPRDKYEDAPSIDLKSWAETRLKLPLVLEADAHAGCLGEWLYGAGHGCDDLVYVALGTGYGCSVILRGRPLRGRTFQAGILGGHLAVNVGGHKCVCPGNGCIEAETGTWTLQAIAAEYSQYPASQLSQVESLDYRALFALADQGDSLATILVERNLAYWGASLVNLTHAYNPERIIMGGGVMKAADRILPYVSEYLRKHVWTASDYPEVRVAAECDSAALLGCRGLFTNQINYL